MLDKLHFACMTFTLVRLSIAAWNKNTEQWAHWASSTSCLWGHKRLPWRKGHCHVWLWASTTRNSLQPLWAPKQLDDYTSLDSGQVIVPLISHLFSVQQLKLKKTGPFKRRNTFSVGLCQNCQPLSHWVTQKRSRLYGSNMSNCFSKDNFASQVLAENMSVDSRTEVLANSSE